jgi:outer membrane protein assembly factor BamA
MKAIADWFEMMYAMTGNYLVKPAKGWPEIGKKGFFSCRTLLSVVLLAAELIRAADVPVLQADSLEKREDSSKVILHKKENSAPDSLEMQRIELMKMGNLDAAVEKGAVKSGSVYRIGEIDIASKRKYTAEELSLTVYVGRAASVETMESIKERIKEFMLNTGFVFSTISFDMQVIKPDSQSAVKGSRDKNRHVRLLIRIAPGSQYKLGGLKFRGTKTRTDVLNRLSLLKRGENYSHKRIELARRKLARSGFFHFVKEGGLYRDSVRHLLYRLFEVSDVRRNRISGIMGYSSEEERGREWTGFLDIELFNLAGTARNFNFHFSAQAELKSVRMEYLEPWIWTLPLGGTVKGSLLLEDSVYSEIAWGFTLFQDLDFYSRYVLSYESQHNEMLFKEDDGTLNSVKSSAIITGIETIFDWRDAAPHTRSGGKVNIGFKGIRRAIGDSVEYLVQNLNSVRNWWPMTRRIVFYNRLAGAAVWPLKNDTLTNRGDRFQFGGTNTLRGYRENDFLTNMYVYANLELQYLLSDRNRAFVFADPGLVNRSFKTGGNYGKIYWRRVVGYGLGADLGSREWVFGISYALSPERSFAEGLLHVRVVNSF